MTPKQFFERLNQMKDGDNAYVIFERRNGKLYCYEEAIECLNEEIEEGKAEQKQ